MDKIDFVVTWVDGADKEWLKKKAKYSGKEIKGMSSAKAYREWGTFKYWFRGVEKYAPWVHKIYLVTDNQVPSWLNTNNPKIKVINHEDYIPKNALPVFNTNAITVNMHKIKGLSNKFVYFNDDMYLINPTVPSDFFIRDLPLDMAVFEPIIPVEFGTAHFQVNNMYIINKYFSKKYVLKNSKVYSLRYGVQNLRTFLFGRTHYNPGFYETHLPESFLKTTFEEIWKKEPNILKKTLYSRFRSDTDVSEWLFRDWQLATGKFIPRNNAKFGKLTHLDNTRNNELWNLIKNSNYKVICVNDNFDIQNVEEVRERFINSLEEKFPHKSSFER